MKSSMSPNRNHFSIPSHLLRALTAACAFASLAACGSAGEATVNLQFERTATSELARSARAVPLAVVSDAPTQFSMKLIAAYITEDIDAVTQSNTGTTSILYLNPDCQDDIKHCDIDGGTAEDGSPIDKIVSTFFDLSSTASANTALNEQERSVTAGTYKYARLEFCKYTTGTSDNIKWAHGSTGEQTFRRTQCAVNSAEMATPLVLTSGSSATVTLSYDLSSAVQVGAEAVGDDCTGDGAEKTCFTLPTFMPSITSE
jgi:hypothetical protein